MFGGLLSNTNSWLGIPSRVFLADVIGEGVTFDFINNQFIPNQFTFTRGPTNGNAWSVNSSGSWIESAANVARFDNTFPAPSAARGLLIEGARTNSIRNPRAEGATVGVIGSGGNFPTHWSLNAAGLTVEIISLYSESGLNVIRVQFSGTATSTSSSISFDGITSIVASPNQSWSSSLFFRSVSASAPPNNYRHQIVGRTSSGSIVSGNSFIQTFSPNSTLSRYGFTATLTSDATIARVQYLKNFSLTVSSSYNFTVDFAWPQLEQGAFVSTPILPPVNSPAASTRAVDLLTSTLSSFGVSANGAGTYLFEVNVPQQAPTGTFQNIFQIDDASDNNAYGIRTQAAANTVVGYRINAGFTSTTTTAAFTPGTTFTCGIVVRGDGTLAFSLGGATAISVSGGVTTGLTSIRVGNNLAVSSALFGYVRKMRFISRVLSDSELQSATVAI